MNYRIMELIKTGSSCGKVFGDPSRLKCLNLQDLHPASWLVRTYYSVSSFLYDAFQ